MRRTGIHVVWTRPALEELKQIVTYIRADNPSAATRFGGVIRTKVARLELMPRLGRIVPEFPESGLRELLHGNYRIIYRIAPERIVILSVYHGQRLLEREPRGQRGRPRCTAGRVKSRAIMPAETNA